MANIKNTYTGDGSTVLFSFTFPYISIQDIVVSVDEVILDRPTEYQLANATTIEFTTAPADGSNIVIYRSTQQEDLKAVFYPGSAIRASDLNDNFTQTLYISQESSATAGESEITAEEAIQASKDAQAAAEASAESADEAAASAAQASQDASQANSKADTALATANSADAKADQAVSTANSAETKADAAVVTADEAKEIAEGVADANWSASGNDIYYQGGDVLVGPDSPDDPNISLNASGSASFEGPVGIGTDSPTENLSIFGADPVLLIQDSETGLAAANSTVRFAESGPGGSLDNYWDVGPKPLTNNNFAFSIGGATSYFNIRFDNGNVGIGTDSPDTKLTVGGSGAALKINSTEAGGNVWGMLSNPGGDDTKSFVFTSRGGASSFGGYSFDTTDGSTTNTNVVIKSDGNFGIGTDSPEAKLTINPGHSTNTSIGGRSIAYGANLIAISGRSGYLVRNSNNYLQDNDNSAFQYIYPFDDGITSDYKVFRTAKGSTLSDVFWTSINGNGYFAGNVGIGTSAPAKSLHILSSSPEIALLERKTNGNATIQYKNSSGTSMYAGLIAGGTGFGIGSTNDLDGATLSVSTDGSASFAGNVGIGTDSPAAKLDVSNPSGDGDFFLKGQNFRQQWKFIAGDDGSKGYLSVENNASNTLAERIRILDNGSVGIGTSSPGYPLTVAADGSKAIRIVTDGTAGGALQWTNSDQTTAYGLIQSNSEGMLVRAASSAANQIYLKADGNVGIGTDDPDARLNVRAGSNNSNAEEIASFSRPDAAVRAAISKGLNSGTINGIAIGTTTGHPFALNTNGVERLYINEVGNVGIGTDAPQAKLDVDGNAVFTGTINGTTVGTSDQRFKENIAPAGSQLEDVAALGGILKNFDWNADAPVNDEIRATRQLGLIAQEAEVICPSLVKTIARTKQGEELTPEEIIPAVYETQVVPAVVDEYGDEVTPETTEQVLVTPEEVIPATYEELDDSYKGISHDALVMKLLGAVAELSAEVATLKAQL